ncbi:MAG: dimethylargininase [Gemmatimonas sp.]
MSTHARVPPVLALTRAVPRSIVHCELTHLERLPIDFARATEQHEQYERALSSLGVRVQRLPTLDDMPDSVFVEDAVVVLPEVAVISRPGAESRRAEIATMATALEPFRPLARIESPGTLDGGDVLCIGKHVYVGESGRTNRDGLRRLRDVLAPLGYSVHSVPLRGCLHLKSAVTEVATDTVLLNPAWVDRHVFAARSIDVHASEPHAANALRIGDRVLFPAHFARTRELLEQHGVLVQPIECDELSKAEAGLTCCSVLLFDHDESQSS